MGVFTIAGRAFAVQAGETASRSLAWRLVTVIERGIALILLLLLAPILFLAALVTAALSRDSPFVAHARVGSRGNRIRVIKLRTMWGAGQGSGCRLLEHLESAPVPEVKAKRDPRVTSSFAAFCRRYSLDEIPQLWQIVRGEMALVGPRPITIEELEKHYGRSAEEVLSVTPGITGLWQVMGRNALTYRQRRALDLFLVRKWSPGLYLFILASTLPAVLSGRNSV